MKSKELFEAADPWVRPYPLRENAIKAVTDWYLDVCKDVYNDLADEDALPVTGTPGFLEIMKEVLGENAKQLDDRVKENLDKELPPIVRTLRRRAIARKRKE